MNNHLRQGYTLIELVIILGIAAVIGTISVMYLPAGFRLESDLDAAALALKVHLFDAQQKSISQSQGGKWGIRLDAVTAGSNFYKIFHGDSYSAGTVEETVILPDSIVFLSPVQGNVDDVIFEKVTGGSLISHDIVLALAGDNAKSRYINISAGTGLIFASDVVPDFDFSSDVPSAPVLSRLVSVKGRVPIYWQAPSNNGGSAIINYKIYRGTSSGGEALSATAENVSQYLDSSGIINGTAYYYKISAVNAVGEGALSNELSVIPADLSLVFTSSNFYKGNLGGLAGADSKCLGMAIDASLGGNWKAWLSDSSISATSRLYHSPAPYKRVDGVKVANNWADLTDGALSAPINLSENNTSSIGYVWTNTTLNGSIHSSNSCNNWTSQSASLTTQKGYTAHWSDSFWTNESNAYNCGYDFKIYCFEQQ